MVFVFFYLLCKVRMKKQNKTQVSKISRILSLVLPLSLERITTQPAPDNKANTAAITDGFFQQAHQLPSVC